MEEKIKPYPYQERGIKKGLEFKRFINGDDMGLGKTLQSIVTVERAHATPCLVICPSSLKINWEREIKKFTNLNPLILTDSIKSTFPYYLSMKMYDVAIVNYESLRKYFVIEAKKGFKLKDVVFQPSINLFKSVILDESTRVKDAGAQQTKFSRGICAGKEYVIMLTGTPVVNGPGDMATQLAIMDRTKDFGGYGKFLHDYGDENSNLEELQVKLKQTCYFRREKKEVLDDLPELTRSTIITPISNEIEYRTCLEDLKKYLSEYKNCSESEIRKKMRMKALVKFMNLRAIASLGKVSAAIEFIRDCGCQITIFCSQHVIVDKLKKEFPDAVSVTGRDSPILKQYAIDSFQKGESRIIICSIKAAGVGITLTAGNQELFIELPWTYADLTQCECRQYRIGQKTAVNSYIMLGDKTIDERIYGLIMGKKSIASRITGACDDIPNDEKYFNELMSCIT
jgi:SWI/SNF-related matrix-associated actin-dependent regulator 1 of chromatin subfamily A